MKKFLLPENGQFYKANLHCHTTVSDGAMTPEQVKEHYMAHGYSIVAFTDHCVLVPHPELADENFLPLNGFETEAVAAGPEPVSRKKHCHLCFVALDKDNVTMPFYHRRHIWGNAVGYLDQIKYDPNNADFPRNHNHDDMNKAIRLGRQAGFFVTYNHPTWSTEGYEDYIGYTGMSAMEIMNYGSWENGYMEYNPRVYDDLLRAGNRIYVTATDDNHGTRDTCGGWTMIKADKLEYNTIGKALENGHFYASWGPAIHSLWYEDGKVHITTSPAKRIVCNYGTHRAAIRRGTEDAPLTEAVFDVEPSDLYFRITVIDEQNRCADTNAYFLDELQ